jgi:hypothetical protein
MPGVMVTSVPYQLMSAEPFVLERPGAEAEVAVPRSPSGGTGDGSVVSPDVDIAGTDADEKVLASSGR